MWWYNPSIRHLPVVTSELGETDRKLYAELSDAGYVNDKSGFVFITEAGRAVLHDRMTSRMRFWIPIVISICSLIISVLAFLET